MSNALFVISHTPNDLTPKERMKFNNSLSVLATYTTNVFELEKKNFDVYSMYKGEKGKKITKTQIKKYLSDFKEYVTQFEPKYIFVFGSSSTTSILENNSYAKLIHKPIYSTDYNAFVIPMYDPVTYGDNPDAITEAKHCIKELPNTDKPQEIPGTAIYQESEILDIIKQASEHPVVAFDVETTGLNPFAKDFKLLSVGLAWNNNVYGIPLDVTVSGEQLFDVEKVKEALRNLFSSEGIAFVGHNISFDIKAIYTTLGVRIQYPFIDTMVLHYIHNENEDHNLDAIISNLGYLSHKNIDWTNKVYQTGNFINMNLLNDFLEYNAKDAQACNIIAQHLLNELDKKDNSVVRMILEVTDILISIELNGFKVDIERLKELKEEVKTKIDTLIDKLNSYPEVQEAIKKLGNDEFNPKSPQQIAKVFEVGNYPIINTTAKGNISTNAETLEILSSQHNLEFAKDLLEYRTLIKLYTSYITPYLEDDSIIIDGFIHPTFNTTHTATGRLSCQNPNLQQIPNGTGFKQIFVPHTEKQILLNGDYSQMELRVEAMLSNDDNLMKAYKEGLDIHTFTASLIHNKDMEEVTPEERKVAKTVNFAILYGASAQHLAKMLNTTTPEMQGFIRKWYEAYPNVNLLNDEIVRFTRVNGYVNTPFNRKRRLPLINSYNGGDRATAERQAKNFLIQSTASDFMLLTLIKLQDYLTQNKLKTKLVNTVHDSIMATVPLDELEEVANNFKKIAEYYDFDWMSGVPLLFEIEVGNNWNELIPLNEWSEKVASSS